MKFLFKVAFVGAIVYFVAKVLQDPQQLAGDDDEDSLDAAEPDAIGSGHPMTREQREQAIAARNKTFR